MGIKNQEPGQSQIDAHKKVVRIDSQKHKQKTEKKTKNKKTPKNKNTKNREPEKLIF